MAGGNLIYDIGDDNNSQDLSADVGDNADQDFGLLLMMNMTVGKKKSLLLESMMPMNSMM